MEQPVVFYGSVERYVESPASSLLARACDLSLFPISAQHETNSKSLTETL